MKYVAPEGCQGVSLLNKWYPVDGSGCVDIPEPNHDLLDKGFVPYVEPVAKEAKRSKSE